MPDKTPWWEMSPEKMHAHANSLVENGKFESWLANFDDRDLNGCLTDEFLKGKHFVRHQENRDGESWSSEEIDGKDFFQIVRPFLFHTHIAPRLATDCVMFAYDQKLKKHHQDLETNLLEMTKAGTQYHDEMISVEKSKMASPDNLIKTRKAVDATIQKIGSTCQNLEKISEISSRVIQTRCDEDNERIKPFLGDDPERENAMSEREKKSPYDEPNKEIGEVAKRIAGSAEKSMQASLDIVNFALEKIKNPLLEEMAGFPNDDERYQEARQRVTSLLQTLDKHWKMKIPKKKSKSKTKRGKSTKSQSQDTEGASAPSQEPAGKEPVSQASEQQEASQPSWSSNSPHPRTSLALQHLQLRHLQTPQDVLAYAAQPHSDPHIHSVLSSFCAAARHGDIQHPELENNPFLSQNLKMTDRDFAVQLADVMIAQYRTSQPDVASDFHFQKAKIASRRYLSKDVRPQIDDAIRLSTRPENKLYLTQWGARYFKQKRDYPLSETYYQQALDVQKTLRPHREGDRLADYRRFELFEEAHKVSLKAHNQVRGVQMLPALQAQRKDFERELRERAPETWRNLTSGGQQLVLR